MITFLLNIVIFTYKKFKTILTDVYAIRVNQMNINIYIHNYVKNEILV